jgi:DNA invertase Pin-like site-specific DNA recombinase
MAKAISYIRFSASHQGRGSTVERQSEYIDEWLNKNPQIKLSNISAKDEGKSGYKGEHLNHGLGKILSAIQSDEIQSGDYILVEAIDRIGRLKPMVMMGLIHEIVSKGVSIITLEDDTEYSIDSLNDNQSALFILIGKIQQAHNYSKSLSNRISAAYERKRREARNGDPISINTSIWLTTKGKIIPDKGEIIKLSINLYLQGYSANLIIKELLVKYPEFIAPHPETFKKWFKNKALIGVWENQNDPIEGVFEPLIDKELFYKLQREIDRRYKKMSPPTTYELSGLVVCGECSSKFYFRTKKHSNYTIIYANCSNYLKRGKSACTNNKTWPYEVLIEIVERTAIMPLMISAIQTLSVKNADKLVVFQEELKEENKKEEVLIEVLMSNLDSNAIQAKMSLIRAEQKRLNSDIKKLEGELSSNNTVREYELEDLENLRDEHESSPRLRQKILQASEYQILINDNLASVYSVSTKDNDMFKLIKRSTKYNCYIVEVSKEMDPIVERMLLEQYFGRGYVKPPNQEFSMSSMLAINREGLLASCLGKDINVLLDNLEVLVAKEH